MTWVWWALPSVLSLLADSMLRPILAETVRDALLIYEPTKEMGKQTAIG